MLLILAELHESNSKQSRQQPSPVSRLQSSAAWCKPQMFVPGNSQWNYFAKGFSGGSKICLQTLSPIVHEHTMKRNNPSVNPNVIKCYLQLGPFQPLKKEKKEKKIKLNCADLKWYQLRSLAVRPQKMKGSIHPIA